MMKHNQKRGQRAAALLLAAALAAGLCPVLADEADTAPSLLPPSAAGTKQAQEPPTVRGEMAKLGPKEGNWLHLTKAQMREDADYLYKTLKENFPYFSLIKRVSGVDMDAEFAACLREIDACETDVQFYLALDRWIEKAGGLGHLMLLQPAMYVPYAQLYKEAARTGSDGELDLRRLAAGYNDERARKSYEGFLSLVELVFARVEAYYAAQEDAPDAQEEWQSIETKILEPGKIAYIAVNSLDGERYEEDKKRLFDFYAQVKDYDHVIFDFTENGGGSMAYFDDLIAAPNTAKPLSVETYQFMKDGSHNRSFFDLSGWKPVSALPKLPRMNKDDLAGLDLYTETIYTVQPLEGGKMLNGKLWMLVSPTVFSSSEYAAMLCKSTGFMTLVGATTGGDGIGSDPLPIVLPNSGLLVRYGEIYGTTADGASSQEWGTEPDIISPKGETALETCLKAIRAQAAGQQ